MSVLAVFCALLSPTTGVSAEEQENPYAFGFTQYDTRTQLVEKVMDNPGTRWQRRPVIRRLLGLPERKATTGEEAAKIKAVDELLVEAAERRRLSRERDAEATPPPVGPGRVIGKTPEEVEERVQLADTMVRLGELDGREPRPDEQVHLNYLEVLAKSEPGRAPEGAIRLAQDALAKRTERLAAKGAAAQPGQPTPPRFADLTPEQVKANIDRSLTEGLAAVRAQIAADDGTNADALAALKEQAWQLDAELADAQALTPNGRAVAALRGAWQGLLGQGDNLEPGDEGARKAWIAHIRALEDTIATLRPELAERLRAEREALERRISEEEDGTAAGTDTSKSVAAPTGPGGPPGPAPAPDACEPGLPGLGGWSGLSGRSILSSSVQCRPARPGKTDGTAPDCVAGPGASGVSGFSRPCLEAPGAQGCAFTFAHNLVSCAPPKISAPGGGLQPQGATGCSAGGRSGGQPGQHLASCTPKPLPGTTPGCGALPGLAGLGATLQMDFCGPQLGINKSSPATSNLVPGLNLSSSALQPAPSASVSAPDLGAGAGGPAPGAPPPDSDGSDTSGDEDTSVQHALALASVDRSVDDAAEDADDAQRKADRQAKQDERDRAQDEDRAADLAAQQALIAETMAAHDQAVADGDAYTEERDRKIAEEVAAAAEAERVRQAEEDRRNQPEPPAAPDSTQPAPPPYRAPEGEDSTDSGDDEGAWTPPASNDSTPVDNSNLPDPNDGWTPSGETPPPPLQLDPAPDVDPRYAQGYTDTDIYREDHPEEFAPPAPQPEPAASQL